MANLMLMLPIVVLYFVASDFVRYLDNPSVGLPGMALYAAGIVAALAVMFVTQMWEYRWCTKKAPASASPSPSVCACFRSRFSGSAIWPT